MLIETLFWLSVGLLIYTYLGYPLILLILRMLRMFRPGGNAPAETATELPSVSFVIAAHNEQHCITEKINDTLDHDYPSDLIEVLVVSDGSTDDTEKLVRDHPSQRVKLLVQPSQRGKNEALNVGLQTAAHRIAVFTDANTTLAPGALRALVAPFRNPRVALVSGQGLYGEQIDGTSRAVSNTYAKYECLLKKLEANLGFLSAADGALYAVDTNFIQPIPHDHVHDLMHPIQVSLAGSRSDFSPEAYTIEPSSKDARAEFRRHVRIIAQGFVVLFTQLPKLLKRGRWLESWILVSHRLFRWSAWLPAVAALTTNGLLLDAGQPYPWLFGAQLVFYGMAVAGWMAEKLELRLRVAAIPYYFCVIWTAGICGFVAFLRGGRFAVWAPAESG